MPGSTPPPRKKVLVIEDELDVASLIEATIQPLFDVFMACDAEQALRTIRDETIDAILVDIMLPNMDGTEFIIQTISEGAGKAIPVLVMTGLDSADLRIQVVQDLPSVLGVLKKPFRFNHLADMVASLIQSDRAGVQQCLKMSEFA